MTRRGGAHCRHRLQMFGTTCNGTPRATLATPATPAIVAPHITATTVATVAATVSATVAGVETSTITVVTTVLKTSIEVTVAMVAFLPFPPSVYPPIPPPHQRGLEKSPSETPCDGRYKHLPGNAFPVARSTVANTTTAAPATTGSSNDSAAAIITNVASNTVSWYGCGCAD